MKKFLLALMFLGITFLAFSQQREKGDLQIGVQGGATLPMDTYKEVGKTKTGYHGGMFIDKFLSGNKFGLGIDVRYIVNSIAEQDSFHFRNGFIHTDYVNKKSFRNLLFTFGPTYKWSVNRFHAEAYIKGGVMLQSFPEYYSNIVYSDVKGVLTTFQLGGTANDASNKANAWAGVGGLRFNYIINPNFAVFAHVDYVQTFGDTFGSKSSFFKLEQLDQYESNPITDVTAVMSHFDHYGDVKSSAQTHHKSLNTGIGVKYILTNRAKKGDGNKEIVKYDDAVKQKAAIKDLQIIVKDKQTNLALSGVVVSIDGPDFQEKSTTNSGGEANKIQAIKPGIYKLIGEKNGIKTTLATLSEDDFKTNSSVIFKELYHDDPRFTLIGETFDCNVEKNLSNINTVLTNAGSKVNASQISDAEGKFIYQLDPQSDFTVVANQLGRYSQTELVSTKGLDRSQTLYVTLKLGVCDLEKDGAWVLKNILYDFDKSNIRSDAALVLDNVVTIMKQNPSLKIELSSHTDSRGNDNYNMTLSQKRAEAAVAYIISHGIAKGRLIAKGYGESRLVNNCGNNVSCSEEQHQENRRTEIKILDYAK